ncbi:hypothetical protein DNJ95_03850 [Stutzerimonas kirkiae]|nr:hypothetical protein DNJ95_03850 [Stutzerimonas kirkiae]
MHSMGIAALNPSYEFAQDLSAHLLRRHEQRRLDEKGAPHFVQPQAPSALLVFSGSMAVMTPYRLFEDVERHAA